MEEINYAFTSQHITNSSNTRIVSLDSKRKIYFLHSQYTQSVWLFVTNRIRLRVPMKNKCVVYKKYKQLFRKCFPDGFLPRFKHHTLIGVQRTLINIKFIEYIYHQISGSLPSFISSSQKYLTCKNIAVGEFRARARRGRRVPRLLTTLDFD